MRYFRGAFEVSGVGYLEQKRGEEMEYSDIYDINHNRTGKIMLRGEKPGEGEYVQASAAIVHNDGYILVTRRHPSKTQGGMWEFPGGGSRAGEEAVDTLCRELEEETGICADRNKVQFLDTVFYEPYHLFLHIYRVESQVKMNELKLQESEVTQAMFVRPEELAIMVPMLASMHQQVYHEIVATLFPPKQDKGEDEC